MRINEFYEATRDNYCWTLKQRYLGKDKAGNPKWHEWETYYPNLQQVCWAILDREAGKYDTAERLLDELSKVRDEIISAIRES